MINSITAKINSTGERDILEHELSSIESSLLALDEKVSYYIKAISDNESMIRIADPDGSIQQKYAQLNSDLSRAIDKIKEIQILTSKFLSKYPDIDSLINYKRSIHTCLWNMWKR